MHGRPRCGMHRGTTWTRRTTRSRTRRRALRWLALRRLATAGRSRCHGRTIILRGRTRNGGAAMTTIARRPALRTIAAIHRRARFPRRLSVAWGTIATLRRPLRSRWPSLVGSTLLLSTTVAFGGSGAHPQQRSRKGSAEYCDRKPYRRRIARDACCRCTNENCWLLHDHSCSRRSRHGAVDAHPEVHA
jgi:hypothetical protein